MTKKSPNMEKDLDILVHEAYRFHKIINLKRSSQRHVIIKLSKIKEIEYF